MTWTAERVERLKELWANKETSATIIATDLGGVTRSAVIGKAHRLGLPSRKAGVKRGNKRKKEEEKPRKAKVKPKSRKPENVRKPSDLPIPDASKDNIECLEPLSFEIPDELVIPLAMRRTIQTLGSQSCRWPIGDPQCEDFHFCGKQKLHRHPYCEFHARKAVIPHSARRKKRNRQISKAEEKKQLVDAVANT